MHAIAQTKVLRRIYCASLGFSQLAIGLDPIRRVVM